MRTDWVVLSLWYIVVKPGSWIWWRGRGWESRGLRWKVNFQRPRCAKTFTASLIDIGICRCYTAAFLRWMNLGFIYLARAGLVFLFISMLPYSLSLWQNTPTTPRT